MESLTWLSVPTPACHRLVVSNSRFLDTRSGSRRNLYGTEERERDTLAVQRWSRLESKTKEEDFPLHGIRGVECNVQFSLED